MASHSNTGFACAGFSLTLVCAVLQGRREYCTIHAHEEEELHLWQHDSSSRTVRSMVTAGNPGARSVLCAVPVGTLRLL